MTQQAKDKDAKKDQAVAKEPEAPKQTKFRFRSNKKFFTMGIQAGQRRVNPISQKMEILGVSVMLRFKDHQYIVDLEKQDPLISLSPAEVLERMQNHPCKGRDFIEIKEGETESIEGKALAIERMASMDRAELIGYFENGELEELGLSRAATHAQLMAAYLQLGK